MNRPWLQSWRGLAALEARNGQKTIVNRVGENEVIGQGDAGVRAAALAPLALRSVTRPHPVVLYHRADLSELDSLCDASKKLTGGYYTARCGPRHPPPRTDDASPSGAPFAAVPRYAIDSMKPHRYFRCCSAHQLRLTDPCDTVLVSEWTGSPPRRAMQCHDVPPQDSLRHRSMLA